MSNYNKLWAAVSAAVILTVTALQGGVTNDEVVLLTTSWLGVVGVWLFPNVDDGS